MNLKSCSLCIGCFAGGGRQWWDDWFSLVVLQHQTVLKHKTVQKYQLNYEYMNSFCKRFVHRKNETIKIFR